MTNGVITVVGLFLLYEARQIAILVEELWLRAVVYIAWAAWVLFIIITSFIAANRRLFDAKQNTIERLDQALHKPVDIFTDRDEDDIVGDYVFKQIQLVNQSPETLVSCFIAIDSFYEMMADGSTRTIRPKSYYLLWSPSARVTLDNKVDLREGIPERLYLARFNAKNKKKDCSLVGVGPNYTPIGKVGTYKLQISLLGDNFPPHTFSVRFIWNGRSDIEILDITKPSLAILLHTKIQQNVRISARSK